jgi:hypothetical protein
MLGLLGMLANWRPAERPRPWLGQVGALFLTAAGPLLLLVGGPPHIGRALLTLGIVWGLFCLVRCHFLARAATRTGIALAQPRWQWLLLVVLGPLLALAPGRAGERDWPSQPRVKAQTTQALTDRGTVLQVFQAQDELDATLAQQDSVRGFLRDKGLADHVIQTAPPNLACNCHGWVFGGGHFIIPGDALAVILRDNDYHLVSKPQPLDLVLFYDEQGKACHSGVVRLADPGGPVLIESKWDWMGRYLHPPEAQPYATRWAYYRSPRTGHMLLNFSSSSSATPYASAQSHSGS